MLAESYYLAVGAIESDPDIQCSGVPELTGMVARHVTGFLGLEDRTSAIVSARSRLAGSISSGACNAQAMIRCRRKLIAWLMRWALAVVGHIVVHGRLEGGAVRHDRPDRRRPTRNRLGSQRIRATLTVLGQPAVHRLSVQSQRKRHILRVRPRAYLLHGPHPQRLKRVVIKLPPVVVPHPAIRTAPSSPLGHLSIFVRCGRVCGMAVAERLVVGCGSVSVWVVPGCPPSWSGRHER